MINLTIDVDGQTYDIYEDFGLVVGNNDYIKEPKRRDCLIEVPGRNGYVDYTESIYGEAYYLSRQISVLLGSTKNPASWDNQISGFRNIFEGRKVKLIFSNDPTHYWIGRASVEAYDRQKSIGRFYLRLNSADPYKYKLAATTQTVVLASTEQTIILPNERKRVVPTITNAAEATIRYKYGRYVISAGTHKIADIVLEPGNNTMYVSGSGTLTITYQEASL